MRTFSKPSNPICSIVFSVFVIGSATAQDFTNLDFESATLVPMDGGSQYVQFAEAFPGWTVTIAGALNTSAALYDTTYLDSAGVCIIDTKTSSLASAVIDGTYTALLQSGLGYSNSFGFPTDTTLSQIGLVPSGAKSLQFKAASSGKFAVTLGGQTLSLTVLGGGTNYALFGADVSQWAGQTAQLSFTIFADKPHVNDESLFLDDIRFSPKSVTAGPPIILSTAVSGAKIEIWWNSSGGTLQSSPVVGPGATWSTVGNQNPTSIPLASGARFFRISP